MKTKAFITEALQNATRFIINHDKINWTGISLRLDMNFQAASNGIGNFKFAFDLLSISCQLSNYSKTVRINFALWVISMPKFFDTKQEAKQFETVDLNQVCGCEKCVSKISKNREFVWMLFPKCVCGTNYCFILNAQRIFQERNHVSCMEISPKHRMGKKSQQIYFFSVCINILKSEIRNFSSIGNANRTSSAHHKSSKYLWISVVMNLYYLLPCNLQCLHWDRFGILQIAFSILGTEMIHQFWSSVWILFCFSAQCNFRMFTICFHFRFYFIFEKF